MVNLIWNRSASASRGKHPYVPSPEVNIIRKQTSTSEGTATHPPVPSPEVNLIQSRATASARRATHPLVPSPESSLPEQLQSPLEQSDTIQEASNTTPGKMFI